jgi:hypothetical protein
VTPGQLIALLVFIAIVIGVAVLGVRRGILQAPRNGRLADRGDEEDRGDE